MLREPQTLRAQPIDVRRLDLLLSVAAELTVAEVVGQDVHDIGLAPTLSRLRRQGDGDAETRRPRIVNGRQNRCLVMTLAIR